MRKNKHKSKNNKFTTYICSYTSLNISKSRSRQIIYCTSFLCSTLLISNSSLVKKTFNLYLEYLFE